jgi:hypothetical protein
MIDYEVGEIPSIGLGIEVMDERNNPINTIGYSSVELELKGSDNERVDLTGVTIESVPTELGSYVVNWPKDRSVFNKRGKYLMRLVLRKPDGSRDYTRPYEIRVREFGRLYN